MPAENADFGNNHVEKQYGGYGSRHVAKIPKEAFSDRHFLKQFHAKEYLIFPGTGTKQTLEHIARPVYDVNQYSLII